MSHIARAQCASKPCVLPMTLSVLGGLSRAFGWNPAPNVRYVFVKWKKRPTVESLKAVNVILLSDLITLFQKPSEGLHFIL